MKLKRLNLLSGKFDWLFLLAICLLVILGLALLYSIAVGSQSDANLLNFKKQIVFFVIGLLVSLVIAFIIDYRVLLKYSYVFYGILLIILAIVLFYGNTIRGTTGWFKLGFLSFQPAEFAKIALLIFLGKYFSDRAKYIGQIKYLILSSLGVIAYVILVVLQPDFGSALILIAIWAGLILLTGIKKSHLLLLILLVFVASTVLWLFVFQDYQKQRIEVFLNPAADPLGSGYNITQAIIAIGSGGFFGKGLGFGSQSQLKFLPESQTDFIFAVLAEELGFIGIVMFLALISFVFFRLWQGAKRVNDNFALYMIIGVMILFFVQMVINIGGNLGLLPITGITLPFVSYGGSSLLANFILVGIIESIYIHS